MHELQRGAESHEGARGRPAGRVGRRRRVPRRRQGDVGHVGCPENRRRVCGRLVLRRVTLAREFHRQELLLPGLRPCLQVMRTGNPVFFCCYC